MDIRQFTSDFLQDFYGTVAYFNIDSVAKKAESQILERKERFNREYFGCCNEPECQSYSPHEKIEHLDSYQKFINLSNTDWDDEFEDEINTLQLESVPELFHVTRLPVKWAYDQCKGECPNGDCIGENVYCMNLKYNKRILQWLIDEHRTQVQL